MSVHGNGVQVNNSEEGHVVVEECPHMVGDVAHAFIAKQAFGLEHKRKCSIHLGF